MRMSAEAIGKRKNEHYFFGFVAGFPIGSFFCPVFFVSCFFLAFAMYGSTLCLIAGLLFPLQRRAMQFQ